MFFTEKNCIVCFIDGTFFFQNLPWHWLICPAEGFPCPREHLQSNIQVVPSVCTFNWNCTTPFERSSAILFVERKVSERNESIKFKEEQLSTWVSMSTTWQERHTNSLWPVVCKTALHSGQRLVWPGSVALKLYWSPNSWFCPRTKYDFF